MKKKNNKNIYIGAAVIAALILLSTLLNNNGDVIEVTVQHPQIGTIAEAIPANGKIKPVTEVKISPDVSGEIVEIYFQEGDTVSKGDLMIMIQQDVYLSNVERSAASLSSTKAQYQQQKAQFNQTELKYARNSRLYADSVISQVDYEASVSEYEVAKESLRAAEFSVKSSEATLKEAKEQLAKTLIYAPISGIISRMDVEAGERVVGTSQMAGTEMCRIADFSAMELVVDVNENDILKVSPGLNAVVEVDAYLGQEFSGEVTSVANSAKNSTTDQVTNFEVLIRILPESYAALLEKYPIPFRPGMSASATISTEKKSDILMIPLQSVIYSDNREKVWVVDKDNKVSAREVRTGIQDINNIEIISGLEEGDEIVTAPYSAISEDLKDGKKIKRRD
ncbi:MAG: efflux RND transporter periplasmic adaptor subunit [Bacteroidales bacterium]|nr:efflux RND transporter periplasmic adaptor subunit [Bacteroidales bacterium]